MKVKKLIDNHWSYVEQTMKESGAKKKKIRTAKYHYKSAAKHFYKHGIEDCDRNKP